MADANPFAAARAALLREIDAGVLETCAWLGFDRLEPAVRAALAAVPRERFVPAHLVGEAYRDHPLPIGAGQTISQPYIVAIMTQLLGVGPGDRVLEVGTGSGYQAAVLAALGVAVFSIEVVPALAWRARTALAGYDVLVRDGDGTVGWPEAAPFDGVIVTAAGPEVPPALTLQLKPGARLVMPIGGVDRVQELTVQTRQADGTLTARRVLPVRFVPITGGGS